jgi:hypothetical protein
VTGPRKEGRGPLGVGYVQTSLAAFLAGQGFNGDDAARGWELLREETPAKNIAEFVTQLNRVAERLRTEN